MEEPELVTAYPVPDRPDTICVKGSKVWNGECARTGFGFTYEETREKALEYALDLAEHRLRVAEKEAERLLKLRNEVMRLRIMLGHPVMELDRFLERCKDREFVAAFNALTPAEVAHMIRPRKGG